jgi:hypothetical protein
MNRACIRILCAAAVTWAAALSAGALAAWADDWIKPYSPPCVEREDVFAFTAKPAVKFLGRDRYEITFAVKGRCDVTVGIVDADGRVVRHLASGVLGSNAPAPFQKNALRQTLYWNGKDDLDRYPSEPEKLSVRVMLGLKPVFERRLGGTSPYDIPGRIQGIGVDEEAVYVFSWAANGSGLPVAQFLRKFDHDLTYTGSLIPPAANLPESKLRGMGYVEYEPGRKAVHAPDPKQTVENIGLYITVKTSPFTMRPAVVEGRIYFTNTGADSTYCPGAYYMNGEYDIPWHSALYYLHTDGSTDPAGLAHRPLIRHKDVAQKWVNAAHRHPRLAASPDGRWIYLAGVVSGRKQPGVVLWRCAREGTEPASPLVGEPGKPGSGNGSFNGACDVQCDGEGRIYVCDERNNRVQVFDPNGSYLKTLRTERPFWMGVHAKSGELYVMGRARVGGKTTTRLEKFSPFPGMKKSFHFDGIDADIAALDSWTARPRLWTARSAHTRSLAVWEERNGSFEKIIDFDEEAAKQAGGNDMGGWHGNMGHRIWCDPVRERVHVECGEAATFCFDLPTGRLLEHVVFPGSICDFGFDKRGYMHGHFRPDLYQPGIGRYDPDRSAPARSPRNNVGSVRYGEVPYDYGVEARKGDHVGIIPVKDSPGDHSKGVELGVNMMGDVVEECHVDYVPKRDDAGSFDWSHGGTRGYGGSGQSTYKSYLKKVREMERRGEEVYFIRPQAGLSLMGATVWTYERTGELRRDSAVIAGHNIQGVDIDEDGGLYFMVNRVRLHDRKHFLSGRMGVFGGESGQTPFTGTLVKSAGRDVRILTEKSTRRAPIQLDQAPVRPPEVSEAGRGGRGKGFCWVEGAEWFYAGASPTMPKRCPCKRVRGCLDWYKRSFVPEAYRHSIGIVDGNGNLILHMGRYGNFDSDGIAMAGTRFVSATDNYAVFDDNGERITVVRLDYHAEETVPIEVK